MGVGIHTIVLLNEHVVKPSSKYLCLYPWISAALNLGQRRFVLQKAVVKAETKLTKALIISSC